MTKASKPKSINTRAGQTQRRSSPATGNSGSRVRSRATQRSTAKTDDTARRTYKQRSRQAGKSSMRDATAGRPPNPHRAETKAATVIEMLRAPDGASLEALMEATGWQAHSIRGFLSGTLKRKQGLAVVSDKKDSGRRYRIPV